MRFVTGEDATHAENRVRKLRLAYVAVAGAFVPAAIVLLLLSPDDYIPFMLLDIFMTAAFGVWSVYFFSVSFYGARKRSAALNRVLNARTETQYAVFRSEDGRRTLEGVTLYAYIFLVKGEEREYKMFEPISFVPGKRYVVESGAGIILSLEEENE